MAEQTGKPHNPVRDSAIETTLNCQISYLPMGTSHNSVYVNRILQLIANSGLKHEVGIFATVVSGRRSELLDLTARILKAAEKQSGFVLDVRFSNICGCSDPPRTEEPVTA